LADELPGGFLRPVLTGKHAPVWAFLKREVPFAVSQGFWEGLTKEPPLLPEDIRFKPGERVRRRFQSSEPAIMFQQRLGVLPQGRGHCAKHAGQLLKSLLNGDRVAAEMNGSRVQGVEAAAVEKKVARMEVFLKNPLLMHQGDKIEPFQTELGFLLRVLCFLKQVGQVVRRRDFLENQGPSAGWVFSGMQQSGAGDAAFGQPAKAAHLAFQMEKSAQGAGEDFDNDRLTLPESIIGTPHPGQSAQKSGAPDGGCMSGFRIGYRKLQRYFHYYCVLNCCLFQILIYHSIG